MAKKRRTTVSSSHYRHYSLIRFLAAIGAVISIVLHAEDLITSFSNGGSLELRQILFPILGILVCLVLLGSLELINHRWVFEMTWLSLLILAILDAILNANVGTLLIVIAALIALIDRL